MSVISGYNIRDIVAEDNVIINEIKSSYKNVKTDEEDIKPKFDGLDINVIKNQVDTVGTVYHGVKLNVPSNASIDKLQNRLHSLIDEYFEKSDIHIWNQKTQDTYEIYVECEGVIIDAIDEYGVLDTDQEISDLYSLHKDSY